MASRESGTHRRSPDVALLAVTGLAPIIVIALGMLPL